MAQHDEVQRILNIKVNYSDAINGILKYRDAISDVKAQEKDLKQQLKSKIIDQETYNKEMEAAKQLTKDYNDSIRVLGKEIQNNLKVEKEQEGSLRQLRAELSNVTKAYDSLSRAEREGAKGTELKNHINKITTELKDAEEGTQRYYRNVGNYQNAILNALGANNGFSQSILSITQNSTTINQAFTSMGTAAKSFGASLLELLTNPVFLAIAGIAAAGMAFKWFYDYNNGIAEATRLTQEFSGLSGNALKGVRDDIQALADTFDKDYKDVLSTADTLVANYGMSWQDANKVIEDGFVSGADLGGNMLDLIKQYAPSFHDAGLSASEMVAVIQQTRSGILTEDGLAIIQKASKNLRDMSTTTSKALKGIGIDAEEMQNKLANGSISMMEAIQEVSEHLKDVGTNSQEAGEIIDNVFGKKGVAAGQEQVKAIADIETNLEVLCETEGEYGDLKREEVNVNKEINDLLAAMFDLSDKGWESMIQNVRLMCKRWLVTFLKGVVDCINYFIDWYNESRLLRDIVQGLINSFSTIWEVCKFVFGAVGDVVKNIGNQFRGLGSIVDGVFSLDLDKIENGYKRIFESGKELWSSLSKRAGSFGHAIATNVVDAYNEVIDGGNLHHIEYSNFDGGSDYGGSTGSGSSGSGAGSGSSGGNGKTGSGKTGTKNTKKTPEQIASEKAAKDQKDYLKKVDSELDKIAKAHYKESEASIRAYYENQIKGYQDYLDKHTELAQADKDKITSLITALQKEEEDAATKFNNEQLKKDLENKQKLIQTQIAAQDTQNALNAQALLMKGEQLNLEEELELKSVDNLENAEVMKTAIRDKYEKQRQDLAKAYATAMLEDQQATAEAEKKVQEEKYEAINGLMSAAQEMTETFSEKSKALAVASKAIALAQIAIEQGTAIARGISSAMSVKFPANIAAIATTLSAILSGITQAYNAVHSAKFATGGYVSGAGTGTSDSINARLSNGESVINANATAMFSPILSAFNQLGGGIPIVTPTSSSNLGEEMLAVAIAKGMALAPSPIVSVEEINRVQNRIDVVERVSQI